MSLISAWIYCLLTLWSWSFALGCTWMQSRVEGSQSNFKVVSAHSIKMLEQMAEEVKPGKNNPAFPEKLYEHAARVQAQERVVFIHDTINDIKKLYITGKYDALTWDQKNLDKFQLDLDRQASELKQCIENQKPEASHYIRRLSRKMREHFRKLYNHLKNQNYSADGWETIRSEVLTHLQRLDTLATQHMTPTKPPPTSLDKTQER